MKDVDRHGIAVVMKRALALASKGTRGIHVSFDLDVCDPSIAPGVGTPVKGGLDYREAHMVMEMIADSERLLGLDLVEISPTAVPPVCRIMDYGKYQYQEQKRTREAKKHQKVILVKEIKFRPKVDEHDYQFKKNHIERFIEDGDKVKATIFFRGREMAHPEIGHRILMRLITDLSDVAVAETMPRQEGNQMHTILTAKKGAPKARPAPRAEEVKT